jgi:hypothetical protein
VPGGTGGRRDGAGHGAALIAVGLATLAALLAGPGELAPSPAARPIDKSFFPAGMRFDGAPVGAWCEYRVKSSNSTRIRKERVALVARSASELTVEVITDEDGPRKPPRYIMQLKIAVDATGGRLKQRMLRTGQAFPKLIPNAGEVVAVGSVGPESLVGKEQVKLPVGSVSARRYRRPWGDAQLEVWINEEASPFALVRSRETSSQRVLERELVATGSGATSQLMGSAP